MKWDARMTRSSKHASLLAHEEAFAADLPPRKKYLCDKVKPAGVGRAAVARLLSVLDHDDDDDHYSYSSGSTSPRIAEEAAIIGGMVLHAVSPPPASQTAAVTAGAGARTVSGDAADCVLSEGLQGGAAPGTSRGHAGVSGPGGGCQGAGTPDVDGDGVTHLPISTRADSVRCFDLGVLIHEAMERYRHEQDERLLRQRLAEWVSVSRAASLAAPAAAGVAVVEVGQALAVGAVAVGGAREGVWLARAGSSMDEGSEDSFVMV